MTDDGFREAIMRRADEYQVTLRNRPRDLAEDLAFCMLCLENGIGIDKVPANEELNEFLKPGIPDPVDYDDGSDQ